MDTFNNKTAVITGAGSGIGRGMALVFARAGMRIVVSDIEADAAANVAKEITSAGGNAIAVTADVSKRGEVEALAAAAAKAYGPVHVLCNNAGVMIYRRGTDATHEDWQWLVNVNLWGVIHGMEAFLPGMRAHGEPAHIVNTASMNGIIPSSYSPMYSATKYGVVGLSEVFANELKGGNVGISILCPGAVTSRIHESERNRPKELAASRPPSQPHERSASYDILPANDPLEVGDMVLNGIRKKQLHIFTSVKTRPYMEARHARMMAEFDRLEEWERSAGKR